LILLFDLLLLSFLAHKVTHFLPFSEIYYP